MAMDIMRNPSFGVNRSGRAGPDWLSERRCQRCELRRAIEAVQAPSPHPAIDIAPTEFTEEKP